MKQRKLTKFLLQNWYRKKFI